MAVFLLYVSLHCVSFAWFFRPDLFSWDKVVQMSPMERLEHAFSKAQTHLGIEKLLDAEGIVSNICFHTLCFVIF